MSFDVFLQRCVNGNAAEVNRQSVLQVLNANKFRGPDEFGFYLVQFPDRSEVEFSAKELQGSGEFTGCAFFIRGLSPPIVEFIFAIAKAGDMIILAAMDDFVPVLSSAEQLCQLPTDLAENDPPPIVCESSTALESLLSDGYAGWKKYRDKIVNEKSG